VNKITIAIFGALMLACSGGVSARTPEDALASFARALRDGDVEAAYSLTSDAYRRRVPLADFERWVRESPDEIQRVAETLSRPAGEAEEEASIEVGEHENVRLVRDPSGWRIASDVVDYYGQRTPRQALRSLVRAVRNRRWDVVLRLVPEADREGMTEAALRQRWEGENREEVERMIAGIRAALDEGAPIEEHGEHAVMPWGERYRAQLVREAGAWKVEDPD
jgi:hypothetical protein